MPVNLMFGYCKRKANQDLSFFCFQWIYPWLVSLCEKWEDMLTLLESNFSEIILKWSILTLFIMQIWQQNPDTITKRKNNSYVYYGMPSFPKLCFLGVNLVQPLMGVFYRSHGWCDNWRGKSEALCHFVYRQSHIDRPRLKTFFPHLESIN